MDKNDARDALGVFRWRKCRCGCMVETREACEDASGRADRCPVCGGKTLVWQTLPAGRGVVVRIRECRECPARFYTRETIYRVTREVTQPAAMNGGR